MPAASRDQPASGRVRRADHRVREEPVPPYQRPPLSKKYLSGDLALERVFLRPEDFYAQERHRASASETRCVKSIPDGGPLGSTAAARFRSRTW